jgi:DNA (cytosine-5)-methyltransferase 1
MKHLDLFSGIGGFALAAGWAGFETIGFAETDRYCSHVLKRHWPDVRNYGDVRSIDGREFRGVDLVTAGFPCQPFSQAGRRRGTADERFLWPELARLLGEIRPRYALLENVPGLLSLDGGRVFRRVLGDLAALGFDASWNCVPASAVGALHRRDRLWIVAYAPLELPYRGRRSGQGWRSEDSDRHPAMADADITRPQGHRRSAERADKWITWKGRRPFQDIWLTEPDVGRVAHGVSKRVDRLRGLGNAIVPQLAYVFLEGIAAMIEQLDSRGYPDKDQALKIDSRAVPARNPAIVGGVIA